MALTHDRPFQMRASKEFLDQIDEWRRQQPDIPPRAEAIRRLVELGLGRKAKAPMLVTREAVDSLRRKRR